MLISSFKSLAFGRSLIYSMIYFFSFCVYFLVPFNLVYFGSENKILKYYILSFFIIGSYAFLQFFFSIFGITLPFSTQKLIFTRGSAFALEPSFYALYAIPFVFFLNAKLFLSLPMKKWPVIVANLFLLVSTTTTAFISYFVFFFVLFFFPRYRSLKTCFFESRRKMLKITALCASLFLLSATVFSELYKKTFLKFFYVGIVHESFFTRFSGIFSALKAFSENLLFGVGIGGIGPYITEQFGLNIPTIGLFDQRALENRGVAHLFSYEPTNVFSEILGSLGIYGLLGFCIFAIVVWGHFRALLRDERVPQEEKANVLALLISVIVSLVCLQINQGLFRSYIWVHLGISLGYVLKLKAKNQST